MNTPFNRTMSVALMALASSGLAACASGHPPVSLRATNNVAPVALSTVTSPASASSTTCGSTTIDANDERGWEDGPALLSGAGYFSVTPSSTDPHLCHVEIGEDFAATNVNANMSGFKQVVTVYDLKADRELGIADKRVINRGGIGVRYYLVTNLPIDDANQLGLTWHAPQTPEPSIHLPVTDSSLAGSTFFEGAVPGAAPLPSATDTPTPTPLAPAALSPAEHPLDVSSEQVDTELANYGATEQMVHEASIMSTRTDPRFNQSPSEMGQRQNAYILLGDCKMVYASQSGWSSIEDGDVTSGMTRRAAHELVTYEIYRFCPLLNYPAS